MKKISRRRLITYLTSGAVVAVVMVPAVSSLAGSGTAVADPAAPKVKVVKLSHDPMHVQANHLTGKPLPRGANKPVKVKAFSDGCDHNYGSATQCVPLRAPNNQPVTCAYLLKAGYLKGGLVIRGKDHLGLLKAGQTRITKDGPLVSRC